MPEQTSERSSGLISTGTKITAVCITLGLVSAYGASSVTDNQLVQFGLLFGIGAVAPTLINESRE